VFGHKTLKNAFFVLDFNDSYNISSSAFISLFHSNFKSFKWHASLGYIGQHRMSRLAKEGLLHRLTKVKLPRCESYLSDNATVKPFRKASSASSSLKLIHSEDLADL